jgi:GDP-4-dehydro-6-deoxy-D-mannose reductase
VGEREAPAILPKELNQYFSTVTNCYMPTDIAHERDVVNLLRELKPNLVIHVAAALRDDSAQSLFRTNVEGTIAFMNAIAKSRVHIDKLIIGSSGSIYGNEALNGLPLDETRRCQPTDLYAASKLACENVSQILSKENSLPTLWARLFNLVGPGQDERHACAKFAAQIAGIISGTQTRTIEVGDLSPTRDFIDVRDAARAIQVLVERGRPGDAYNISSGKETSIRSVLDTLLHHANLSEGPEVVQTYTRRNDIPRYYGDPGRMKSLGFVCQLSLSKSLRDLLKYYLEDVSAFLEPQHEF